MFSERFKSERKKLKLTQEQIAKKLNVSRSNVANWEKGSNLASLEMLTKCSKLFDCSIDYLLGNCDYRNSNELVKHFDEIYKDKLPQLHNESRILNKIDIEVEDESESKILFDKLKDIGLLNNDKTLNETEINIIVEFINNNKEMLKALIERQTKPK